MNRRKEARCRVQHGDGFRVSAGVREMFGRSPTRLYLVHSWSVLAEGTATTGERTRRQRHGHQQDGEEAKRVRREPLTPHGELSEQRREDTFFVLLVLAQQSGLSKGHRLRVQDTPS